MEKRLTEILEIIVFVLVFALLAGFVAFIYRFTNGGTTDLATFYVEYNGKELLTNTEIGLKNGEKAVFQPKYLIDGVKDTFGNLFPDSSGESAENKGFSVKIVPNVTTETKFNYTVGDDTYQFEKLQNKDFCEAFGFVRDDTSFFLKVDIFSVAEFISSKHSGKVVTLPENFDDSKAYFNLIISSYDEKSKITIGLKEDKSITFTIDGKAYTAERGMTLSAWAASDLCKADIAGEEISVEGKKYCIYDKKQDGAKPQFP